MSDTEEFCTRTTVRVLRKDLKIMEGKLERRRKAHYLEIDSRVELQKRFDELRVFYLKANELIEKMQKCAMNTLSENADNEANATQAFKDALHHISNLGISDKD